MTLNPGCLGQFQFIARFDTNRVNEKVGIINGAVLQLKASENFVT